MIKLQNLVKNSFTLLETIISISLLIIVISGFKNSSYYDDKNSLLFQKLNDLENKFITKDYSTFTKTTHDLKIILNSNENTNILVKKYTFENDEIKIYKYEK